MSCHALKLFINNVHWLHLIDSTATASTKISNYFCTQLTKQHIELFTKVHHTDFLFLVFASCFYYYFLLLFLFYYSIHTYDELTDSFFWLVEFSTGILVLQITDFHFANYIFLFCKALAYFHVTNYRFLGPVQLLQLASDLKSSFFTILIALTRVSFKYFPYTLLIKVVGFK